jgi:uncharacterized protein
LNSGLTRRDKELTTIKTIGRYCVTDENGYIKNDSDIQKIDTKYLEVIDKVKEKYLHFLGDHIHSIYIRGSIPRGLGIEGVSDLDTIAVTNTGSNELDLKWVDQTEQELNEGFSCINGVELCVYCIKDIVRTPIFSIIPFMVKTHSICIYGEDVRSLLPRYKPDEKLANEHLIHLKSQIEIAKSDLMDNDDNEDIIDCCSWIMKMIVRAGLALVIVDEKLYTRDLYPAYELFTKHYPEKQNEMRQALLFAIAPVSHSQTIVDFLNDFGNWMINEAEKWIQIHNPDRVLQMQL